MFVYVCNLVTVTFMLEHNVFGRKKEWWDSVSRWKEMNNRMVHGNYYWQQKNLLSPVVFFLDHPVVVTRSLRETICTITRMISKRLIIL